MPMPVTATSGRPRWSRRSPAHALILVSRSSRAAAQPVDQRRPRRASGRPVTTPASAGRRAASRASSTAVGGNSRRSTAPARPARHWPGTAPRRRGRSAPVARTGAAGARRQHGALLAGRRPRARRAGDHGGVGGHRAAPSAAKVLGDGVSTSPGVAPAAAGCTAGEPGDRRRRRAPRRGSRSPAPGRRRPSPATRPPPCAGARPDRREGRRAERAAAARTAAACPRARHVGAADQDRCRPARPRMRAQRDAHRVDAGRLLAHEGARGAGDAVHDRDVAGQQVGQLRQEQRRPQVGRQPLVQEGVAARRAAAAGRGSGRRPRRRARRRRRRRSGACARAARGRP